jgi:hypothetical protein
MNEVLKEIELRFEKALEDKTGWGKNELLNVYKDITRDVYREYMTTMFERKQ